MPNLDRLIRRKGLELHNFIVPTPSCCPQRVCLWTGRYVHNHNVSDLQPPFYTHACPLAVMGMNDCVVNQAPIKHQQCRRSSFLVCASGMQMTMSRAPHGAYRKFFQYKMDQSYLPVWLQARPYRCLPEPLISCCARSAALHKPDP